MKIKILLILLAVSAGFNVFYAMGLRDAQNQSEQNRLEAEKARKAAAKPWTFEQRARRYAAPLNLDTQQEEVFEETLRDVILEREKIRRESKKELDVYLTEIVKDNPDRAVIEKYLNSPNAGRRRRLMSKTMLEFMQALRPSQRKILTDGIRAKAAPKAIKTK